MARKGENIFHRKDGRWEARYVKGYNIDGSYKYGYVYGKTYLEVKTRRIAILMELEKQEKKKDGFVRFNDRIDEWLKRQKVSVKLSTYSYYINVVERHIRPLLGNMLLKNINSVCITDFINVKNEENNLKDSTLKEIMIVLKQILSFCDIVAIIVLFLLYGPYPDFRNWLVTTAMSTMNHQYLATTFYSEERINKVLEQNTTIEPESNTDTSLIMAEEKPYVY